MDEWLEGAYADETLVTQLDGRLGPGDAVGPVGMTGTDGVPTSSSTLPGLVVRMLEDLGVRDGDRVLEIGTGTGYSTALLGARLGDRNVTLVEVDPDVAARAAVALEKSGCHPTLLVGDGLAGHFERAPYDKVIAACSVRRVPDEWIAQTRPGGTILVTISGWIEAYGLARPTVGETGTATGRFLPGTISFMIARPQAAPSVPAGHWAELCAGIAGAEPRPTTVGADIRHDWTGWFVTQLAAPHVIWQSVSIDDGPFIDYFTDPISGACAAVAPEPDGSWSDRQVGEPRFWHEVERAVQAWRQAGSPGIDRFGIQAGPGGQTVWLDTGDGRLTWTLR